MNKKRKRSSVKKRRSFLPIIVLLAVLIIALAVIIFFYRFYNKGKKPSDILQTYLSYIKAGDYENMYALVDAGDVTKEDFISRNQNIYEGIGCSDVDVKIISEEADTVSYTVTLSTLAGEITYDNKTSFTQDKENETLIVWDDSMIFPDLTSTDKIRIYTDEAKRGQIVDRNNVVLAGTGSAYSVGLVPGKMNEDHSSDLDRLSQLLGMSSEEIESELSKSWVTDDSFVP